jgi:hypothetical protein
MTFDLTLRVDDDSAGPEVRVAVFVLPDTFG